MASSQKLTEYERKLLDNIRRNDGMMAALKVHSKATELSTASSKRQRVGTKSYKKVRPEKKKPKTQTPIETRRSLRAQGMPPDDIFKAVSQSNSNTSPMLDLGPRSMRDAYRETASEKLLMERILRFSKKPHEEFEFNGGDSIKGVCEGGTGSSLELNSLSLNPENIARVVPGGITDLRNFNSSTFLSKAIWVWDDSHIFIGNMKRGVDVISPTPEKTIFTLQSPHMSAVPRRFDAHPSTVGTLAGATCLGQVYMWTLG